MVQVSLVGYASAGAFLGLAYFDFYYTLIAIVVLCKVVLVSREAARKAEIADNAIAQQELIGAGTVTRRAG
jgi:uncharacterized membrane protein